MAERRMIAKAIIDSDAFLEMPVSAQNLYFQLNMRADDDGFVGNPRSIMRIVKASEDDMLILINKRFVLAFESGVVVIKHWRIHNYIQKDRYKETTYIKEKNTLKLDAKNSYTEMETKCIQSGYNLDTQVSIDKDSIDKDSIELIKEKEEEKEYIVDYDSSEDNEYPRLSEIGKFIQDNNLEYISTFNAYKIIHSNGIEKWQEYLKKENEKRC